MNCGQSVKTFAIVIAIAFSSSLWADVVIDWNQIAANVLVSDVIEQHPGQASRTMAMVNLAIYDSFQMTLMDGMTYYDYAGEIPLPSADTSREAAAIQGAYTVLANNYPDQQASLEMSLANSLMAISQGPAKVNGIALGDAIGHSIVNRRANDGYDANVQFVPTGQVGHWEPDPLNPDQEAWGPVWGEVQPFSLLAGNQFTAPPMPDLTSQAYADAFNEVKDLGALLSPSRTADQTEAGLFWAYDRIGLGTPMRQFNRVLQAISEQEQNTPEENAELFARATVAMVDAGIASWNAKYDYDFWRPISAIRRADEDGNADTVADPNWVPLGSPGSDNNSTADDFTPPFPTYVSGHSTFGAALFTTLADFYETDNIGFTLTSEELPGVERDFASFSEAMIENGRSRVYLGVHFNFDDIQGQELGVDVADYIASRPFVAAVPEPSCSVLLLIGLLSLRRYTFRDSQRLLV